MKINNKERPLIYTNFFLLVPLVIGIRNHYVYTSILLALVTLSSTAYHTFKKPGSEWWWNTKGRSSVQTALLVIEVTLSTILGIWSVVLFLQKPQIEFFAGALLLFIPSFILYLSTNDKKYIGYHSVWHFVVALVISLALI